MWFSKSATYYFLFMVGFLTLQSACKETDKNTVKKVEVAFAKEGELSIYKAKTDSLTVQLNIEIADTDYETQTGLMYRNAMEEQQGMLFIFPEASMHSFYMKNTQIPLDILFIDKNLKIASIHKNAEPYSEASIPSKVPVQYVLEINAGLTAKWGLAIGDSISILK